MPGLHNNSPNLSSFCRSIGLVYDRTAPGAEPIGSTFLVTEKKTASLASLLLPFAKNPEALKLVFPYAEREFGVSAIHFHAKFDQDLKKTTLYQGTLGNGPEAALQKYNCCVLDLTEQIASISDTQVEQVSQNLRFPLNLTDEGFRGSLTEIELPLVIQTLNNAKKQGILYICDELHRPLAQIYCQDGRIVAAKYRSLFNELALFQIVEKRLSGRFIFRACKPPAWLPAQTISRTTDTILIEAMRRQDEIANLKQQLSTKDYFLVRAYKQLYLDGISQENRQAAEMIWRALDGTTPADQLWCLVPLDDHTILSALLEMYVNNQCMRVPLAGTMQFAIPQKPADESYAPAFRSAQPLPLGTQMQLNAFDTISSVSIDPITSKPRVKVGALLGAIDPYDPEHLLHDIPLLPWASGSPLIKDDLVIGMHCGVVPNSSAVDNTFGVLQQMLWCDAIAQVLLSIPGTSLPPPVPLTAPAMTSPAQSTVPSQTSTLVMGSATGTTSDAKNKTHLGENKSNDVYQASPTASLAPTSSTGPQESLSKPGSAATTSGVNQAFTDSGTHPVLPSPTPSSSPNASGSFAALSAASSQAAGVEQSQFESAKRRALASSESPTVTLPKGPPGCREIASLKCSICGERTFSSARRCMRCLNEFVPQLRQQKEAGKLDFAVPLAAVLVVAMAASAAFAWTRLPTPVFEKVEIMSIPKQPWVEATIESGKKVSIPGGKVDVLWALQPDRTKLPSGSFIHLRCRANKRSHLRLLYKGSGGVSELKLDMESPAEGTSITYPSMTSVVGPTDAPLNLLTVGGPAGGDEFIVIASSNNNEFPMLEQTDMLDKVFAKANTILKLSKTKTGVLVFGSQLMPAAADTSSSPDNTEYFITSATVYH